MGNGESRRLAAARIRRPQNAPDSVKTLSTLSWDEFAACVRSVNAKCRGLVNEQKEYFVFCIRHNAVRDDGWKDHLQLICIAKHVETGDYRFVRTYSLQRFLNIYHSFAMIPEVANVPAPLPIMTDSILVECSPAPETSQPVKETDAKSVDEKSCCICFDREADTILSCCHSFCTVCVATWSEYRTQFQCPLCKAAIRSPIRDSWELMSEQPTREEMEGYFTSLMSQGEPELPIPSAVPSAPLENRSGSPLSRASACD
ncbi:hypothetical protein PRIPAC_96409 [Pristionchus pacificus]|uniref:Zinc finger protein n=1 Tax=Pristionchus pacificus TaxID=54126 RepID=A0A2A6D346_PRIPA|nr:hypothetical protein PRIPAC_96409 [Pristionchus pacificus]|eukprot:PDM84825.1 zinc finger protein [Pristionchus pacificus]